MLLGARQFFERRGAPTPTGPYDAEVEYLESTGTQYIDTGIYSRDGLIVSTDVCYFNDPANVATHYIFGAGTLFTQLSLSYRMDSNYLMAGLNSSATPVTGGAMDYVGKFLHVVISSESGSKYCEIDGDVVKSLTTTSTSVSSRSLLLFNSIIGQNLQTGALCRVGEFAIKDTATGQFLIDLVPVRFTNEQNQSEGAMYDRVSGQLFRNAGSGAFQIGPDKS